MREMAVVIGNTDGAMLRESSVAACGADAELAALLMQTFVAGVGAGRLEDPVAGLAWREANAPRLAAIPEA